MPKHLLQINCRFFGINNVDKRAPKGVDVEPQSTDNLLRAQFHITGLSCASCVNKVERYLKKKRGEPLYYYMTMITSLAAINTLCSVTCNVV